jgi:thioredoxin reductase (NADPH)
MKIYDVVIIGSGPAGLTAGLYTARAGLKTLILENQGFGGYLVNIDLIENYPGFSEGIRGNDLARSMMKQAMAYGVEFQLVEATGLEIREDYKVVKAIEGEYWGKTIIVAGGSHPKKLGVPGEAEFASKGVAYCAVCEGGSFSNKVVAVAGGGDAGITEGLYLSRIASRIIIIEMMLKLTATDVLQKRALNNPKIEVRCGTKIKAILGDGWVKEVKLLDVKTGQESSLEVQGVFIHIGLEPNSGYLKGALPLDSNGQVLVNDKMEAQVPGCFAAGDIRCNSSRQVITAAGDGATAALSASKFLMVRG